MTQPDEISRRYVAGQTGSIYHPTVEWSAPRPVRWGRMTVEALLIAIGLAGIVVVYMGVFGV